MNKIPTFALVGAPNDGKSTVVSTLSFDPTVAISPISGFTIETKGFSFQFDGREIIRFYDTPGFQQAEYLLKWLDRQADAETAAEGVIPRRFIEEHKRNETYDHECQLMGPLADGAAIVYIVDGGRPIEVNDKATVKILQACGTQRFAIINPKGAEKGNIKEWENYLRQKFTYVETFHATMAGFEDIIGFLETIAPVTGKWKEEMREVIAKMKLKREDQIEGQAASIIGLLEQALSIRVELPVANSGKDYLRAKLEDKVKASVHKLEASFRKETRERFNHGNAEIKLPSLIDLDFFHEKVRKTLGLTTEQLVLAGAAIGFAIGLCVDASTSGFLFGIPTLLSTAAGALFAWYLSDEGIRIGIPLEVLGVKLKGEDFATANIDPKSNTPWILLDRAIAYSKILSARAHGNREESCIDDKDIKCTTRWPSEQRDIFSKLLGFLAGKGSEEQLHEAKTKAKKILVQELNNKQEE